MEDKFENKASPDEMLSDKERQSAQTQDLNELESTEKIEQLDRNIESSSHNILPATPLTGKERHMDFYICWGAVGAQRGGYGFDSFSMEKGGYALVTKRYNDNAEESYKETKYFDNRDVVKKWLDDQSRFAKGLFGVDIDIPDIPDPKL